MSSDPHRPRSPRLLGRALASVLLTLAALFAFTASAEASGTPDISFTANASTSTLLGGSTQISFSAHNPTGEPYGYNLSYRAVLPAGAAYAPGSAPIDPQVINNAPSAGETTLIWSNVSDLSPNSTNGFTFGANLNPTLWPVGSTPSFTGGAYINCDARFVPSFDAAGLPTQSGGGCGLETSYTGSDSASATTDVTAIRLLHSTTPPSGSGGHYLRGVHDFKYTYRLRLINNSVLPTDNARIEEWLPAGVEYLGCLDADNTTDAPTNPGSTEEYPGSGSLLAGPAPLNPNCLDPVTVETLSLDPDGAGPLPTAVYTHLIWDAGQLGNLAPGDTINISFAAGIPIRENTTDWTGPVPDTDGPQGANLDNNSGAETFDEQALAAWAEASGDFDPDGVNEAVSSDATASVSAEDVAVNKGSSTGEINQGEITTWTMTVRSSEYRTLRNIELTDTLPNGLCPLGPVNYEATPPAAESECDPVSGETPSEDYRSVTENADGTWTLTWDQNTAPSLTDLGPSSAVSIDFPTRARSSYQSNFAPTTPLLAADSWSNSVEVAAEDWVICAPDDPFCVDPGGTALISHDEADGTVDTDTASASQTASSPAIKKEIAIAPGGFDCTLLTYTNTDDQVYGPADRVCYRLHIEFPGSVDTAGVRVSDFLPPGSSVPFGGISPTANNTVSVDSFDDSTPGVLQWVLGSGGDVPGGDVFEYTVAVDLGEQNGEVPGDLVGNLLKASFANTAGTSFPLRAERNSVWTAPILELAKDVTAVNGSPAANGAAINGGENVEYRIRIDNTGDRDANDAVIIDELPAPFTCTEILVISDGPSCSGSTITWNGVDVVAGDYRDLTYTLHVPDTVEPNQVFENHAGIARYHSDGNAPGAFASFYPADNIDPDVDPDEINAPAADDRADVHTNDVTLVKTRSTEITQSGNNAASQATIGEKINYTVTLTLPGGTTLNGTPQLTDPLGTRQTYVAGSLVAEMDGGALPPGVTASFSANTLTADFPSGYVVAPPGETYTFEFAATLDNDWPDNQRLDPVGGIDNNDIANRADFDWTPIAGARNLNASVSTQIVEPLITTAKNVAPSGPVAPGQILTYTVTTQNSNATRVSQANDVTMTDHVPVGLTPIGPAPANTPIADGGTTADGGVWDQSARTISWSAANVGAINANASKSRTYRVSVDSPVIGGVSKTNTVNSTAASLGAAHLDRRSADNPVGAPGYKSQAQRTVTLADPVTSKGVSPTSGTPGEKLTYTINVTIPHGMSLYNDTVIDELPDGIVFDGYASAACISGCGVAPVITPTTLTPVDLGAGKTRIGWSLGSLSSSGSDPDRVVRFTYDAHIARDYDDGDPVTAHRHADKQRRQLPQRDRRGRSGRPGPRPDGLRSRRPRRHRDGDRKGTAAHDHKERQRPERPGQRHPSGRQLHLHGQGQKHRQLARLRHRGRRPCR